jgi:hypothetical protein
MKRSQPYATKDRVSELTSAAATISVSSRFISESKNSTSAPNDNSKMSGTAMRIRVCLESALKIFVSFPEIEQLLLMVL